MLRHPSNWKRISMAAALAYRWDGARTRLYFQTQDGNYNEESLADLPTHRASGLSDRQSADLLHKRRTKDWLHLRSVATKP